jgi:phosphoribosylanthranilate isomerase
VGVFVKICGICSDRALEASVSAGADAVGFIVEVPLSPRNLSIEKAKKLRDKLPCHVKSVLVMVPETQKEILQTIEAIQPDMVQLHGENIDTTEVPVPVIRGVNQKISIKDARQLTSKCDFLLLDTYKKNIYGGTGKLQDPYHSKSFIEQIAPHPVILAGGLRPENVAKIVELTNPFGVDVSTGVETSPGVKDPEKIIEFIEAVKTMRKLS